MAGSVFSTVKKTVSGAVGVGRHVGGRAVAVAGPRIVDAVGAVRTRITRPHAVAPAPRVPTETEQGRPSRPSKPSTSSSAPTPASVAKNIAKHDPATEPVIPKRKPVKRSVPGAKLPAPRT